MRGAGRLYLLQVALGILGAALLTTGATLVISPQTFAIPSSQAISDACHSWVHAGGPAALLGLSIAGLALTALGLGLGSVYRQVQASRRYLRALLIGTDSIEIAGVRCQIVDCAEPLAFCAGFLRPRVYLSRGAHEQLDVAELRAVVAHEAHHRARRDPLRLLAARALADSLFFLPILRRISDRYSALGELAADEAAVRAAQDRGPLASALLKFSESSLDPAPVVSIAPERVDHLMGDPDASRWKLPPSAFSRSVLALVALGAVILLSWHGILDPNVQVPLLLAAACMGLMICGPIALALGALLLSRRVPLLRRT